MSNNNLISIDLAKNVFQVCLLNEHNKVLFNKKVRRAKLFKTVLMLDATRIVMEACYSSNHWGRLFQNHGYKVDLVPPHQAKPFLTGNKNDQNDVIAIAEASRRPKATFVAVKSLEQQDVQSLDRIRDRLVKGRTAVANQLRGLLAEYGVIIEKKIALLRREIPFVLEDAENQLTVVSREFIYELYQELLFLDEAIAKNETKAASLLSQNDDYRRLQTIPGIGPIVGRAIICSVNDANQFKNGRQMAAWIGITPKQHASGEQSRMGGISKRGNQALRKQLIHGARAVVRWCEDKDDELSLWLQKLLKTKPTAKVVVALANKIARIAWAVISKKQNYKPSVFATAK
jgi:transposase